MEQVIDGWKLEVDEEATRRWYQTAEDWDCGCGHCRNFLAQGDAAFPEELRACLSAMGVLPAKASYVCQMDHEGERNLYQIQYPLVGRILERGPESKEVRILTPDERSEPDGAEGFPQPRIELELWLWLPWVLHEPQQGPHQLVLDSDVEGTEDFAEVLQRVIPAALDAEGVELPCEINVLFTDDAGIHAINLEQRGVDRPTDVLSFPMFDFTPGEPPLASDEELLDPGSRLLPLGDMVFSVDRIRAQAEEFGHSRERELAYLAVHSVLHLLGYDHMDDGAQKAQMREREEKILNALGITRD